MGKGRQMTEGGGNNSTSVFPYCVLLSDEQQVQPEATRELFRDKHFQEPTIM